MIVREFAGSAGVGGIFPKVEAETHSERWTDASLGLPHAEIDSATLLKGSRSIVINHHGERYRLMETRRGQLLLQKKLPADEVIPHGITFRTRRWASRSVRIVYHDDGLCGWGR